MRRLCAFFALPFLLTSCGGGTDESQPFQPGIFQGTLDVRVDSDTKRRDRDTCSQITAAFLQGGIYRINIKDQGDDMMLVEHESGDGVNAIANIDHQQTAFGAQEKGQLYFQTESGDQGQCTYTFRGHFVSENSDTIYESGTIDGKCSDDITSVDCVFQHDMTMRRT